MRTVHALPVLFALTVALCLPLSASAQVPDPVVAAEAPRPGAGHHYIGMGAETVNPADGSLSFDLPLQPPAGRGLSWRFGIRYSGGEQFFLSNWSTKDNELWWWPNGYFGSGPLQVGGWSYDVPSLTATTSIFWQAYIPTNCYRGTCQFNLNQCYGNDSYIFHGLDGNLYSLPFGDVFPDPNNTQQGFCNYGTNNQKSPASNHGILSSYQSSSLTNVVDPSGTTYQFQTGNAQPMEPTNPVTWGYTAESITDRNGNQLTVTANGYKDSTGRTAISWTGIGNTGDQITVSGLSSPVTLKWTTTPVTFPETGYNLDSAPSTCTLAGSFTNSISVLSEIDLPNGQKYTFQYDGTYGRVSKITFPDGGYVRYLWGLYRSAKSTHSTWVAPGVTGLCDFVFDIPAITDRFVSFDGSTEVLHQQFSYAATTWSNNSSWLTKQTTVTSTDLLTSQVTKTIYNYSPATTDNNVWVTNALYSLQAPVETNVLYQDGSGKTFKEVNKTWLSPHVMLAEQTILYDASGNRNAGSGTVRCYDANEQATNLYEYGFQTEGSYPGDQSCYSSATKVGSLNNSYLGPLRRQTSTAYHTFFTWNGGIPPTWSGTHIVNAPDSVTVADGTGATAKQALFSYDENTLQSSGAINLTNPGATRANITTQQNLISGSTYAKTMYTYFDTGQVYQKTDPCGNAACADITGTNHTTTYSYADNYASGTGTPPGQTFAYLTQVTHPPTANANHTRGFTWGYNDGLIRSSTDVENNLTTSFTYNSPPSWCSLSDGLDRLSTLTNPDGGVTSYCYNDTPPAPTVTAHKQINSSQTLTTVSVRDGMGHVKETQLTSDPQGIVYADTTFDGFGRVWKQSNPYRSGSDITTTTGTTVLAYDALGRKLTETYPDNSVLTTAFCGPNTLVTDATQRWRRSRTDGLGFLVEVDEPNAVGASVNSNGCPGTNEPIWNTYYGYDSLGNLLCAAQKGNLSGTFTNCTSIPTGWHPRTFSYDSLSRLLTSSNPEVGLITYVYDVNSNVNTKTDARSLTTTYGYDDLNRPLSRTYSNNDPSVSITYDQPTCLDLSACQNVGRRTSMTDAAGTESWAYQVDSAHSRSVHEEKRTTNSITKPSTNYLDLAGNVTQAVYPTNRVMNYTYDNANRPSTAIDGSNGITYATDFQSVPTACLAGKVCYTPQGTFYALSIGQATGFTGLNLTHTYNNRLQPTEFKASSSGGNAIDISYCFYPLVNNTCPTAPQGGNNGIVTGIANNVDSTRSQTFTYDQLNRLTSALTTSIHATSPSHCWGETYQYDGVANGAWGNLTQIAATTNANYTGCSQESGFTTTTDGNNHIGALAYDASGNATSDGVVTNYQWDAESQLKSAAGVTYTYDGDGRRVSKVGSTGRKLYWYGSGGDILAETDTSGNTTAEYVFFGGKRVAMIPSSGSPAVPGNPTYYVEDMLGSSRVLTTNSGVLCYDADLYPYGGERAYTDTCPQNYKFEGKERDTETGNDDFGARYYSNRFGRWLSADWSAVPVPVPYANLTNPQTLNLYSMVADDPESFADLDGHCTPFTPCSSSDLPPGAARGDFIETAKGFGKQLLNDAVWVLDKATGGRISSSATLDNEDQKNGASAARAAEVAVPAMGSELAATSAVEVVQEDTVTRYMGPKEAAYANDKGSIPNFNEENQPKPIHVTTDAPLDSASAAKQRYELPADPTHRATVPADRAGQLGPTPDGRPKTSGGGSQAATNRAIPVKPEEIKKLNP